MLDKQALITSLNLEPHAEGGFYKRTIATGHPHAGERFTTTCIYFLIEHGNPSSLHKIDADEYWMYHCGTSDILIKGISKDSVEFSLQAGSACMQWQHLIPKDSWFGARTLGNKEDDFALVSCICTPGFDFNGFVLGQKAHLVELYPAHENLIDEMCKK